MIRDEIRIRLISANDQIETIKLYLNHNIQYVEQLVYKVLADVGMKPACKMLFGLKLTKEDIWFSPNEPVRNLISHRHKKSSSHDPKYEIRLRFRPGCLSRLSYLDDIAFEMIFNQIRRDFMSSRFIDHEQGGTLWNDHVLGMITLNLMLYSGEQRVRVEDVLNHVKPKDYIPKSVAKWQYPLLFSNRLRIQEALKSDLNQVANDTRKLKRDFIGLFLLHVATDYNSEIYDVIWLTPDHQPNKEELKSVSRQLRVRYDQSQKQATCLIETRIKLAKKGTKRDTKQEKWTKICPIDTIIHATLKDNYVQVIGPSEISYKFQFRSVWHAKSFLSCIDGYYRLMVSWNFNLSREISSPELKFLAKLGCFGPIGTETAWRKLLELNRPSSYLVRKCMENQDRFQIDTFICEMTQLTIHVDWNPDTQMFIKTGHAITSGKRYWKKLVVSVETGHDNYSTLKALIEDIEIRIEVHPNDCSPLAKRIHQLKFMICPAENDIYPTIMLSQSVAALRLLEKADQMAYSDDKTKQEPTLVLPSSSLHLIRELPTRRNNGFRVDLAKLDDLQQVVTKYYKEQPASPTLSDYSFHYCPNSLNHSELRDILRSNQLRLADWLFIKSGLFAKTIGYVMTGTLVQEYFPCGSLDLFLKENPEVDQFVKLSAAFQLSRALLFLDGKRIIHGKIRCHNLMVAQVSPIRIKLTDPLGAIDIHRDQAFIPSEYFSSSIQVCLRKYYSGIDIWATGTTIWQIFNQGLNPPPGCYANKLTRLKCPMNIWNLLEKCWIVERNFRMKPQVLNRDLFDMIAWEHESHNYFYIYQEGLNENNDESPPTQSSSTNSDQLTLDNVDSSVFSSPNSTYSNGSKTRLISNRISSGDINDKLNFHGNEIIVARPYQFTSTNRKINWSINWLNLRKISRRGTQHDLQANSQSDSFSDIFGGSQLSLACGSELTGSTELMESESISEALDRCVWQVDSNCLQLGAEIGRGSSGVVIKGIMSRANGQEEVVAVKRLSKDCRFPNLVEDLKREFDILKKLDHRNIVKTLGFVDDTQLMLIFEYMPLGSLLSCLRNLESNEDLYRLPLKKYALDVANGMEYLETKRIVHRDLALRNILLNDRHEAKICDFGLAQSLDTNDFYRLETDRALPLKWYAPETLTTWIFTHKSDVWSYGVVLWEIYSGGDNPQYSGTYANLSETLKHERLPMPPGCPKQLYDLMLACWEYNPDDRKSFMDICLDLNMIVA